jgi:MATE family multidrug resistance protein
MPKGENNNNSNEDYLNYDEFENDKMLRKVSQVEAKGATNSDDIYKETITHDEYHDPAFDAKSYTMFGIMLEILKSSIPATMGLLFVFILETINIIILGQHNNATLIAAIGIGTLYVNATGYIPAAGLLGGVDTLCSQAFGQHRLDLVGLHSSIGRISVTLYFFCITIPINFLTFTILNGIGIDESISLSASEFCHAMSISVFFALQFNSSIRYLQSMNIFIPGSIITLVTAVLHPFWCYLLVNTYDYGVVGAGISMGITQFTNFILITLYIKFYNPYPESFVFISKKSLIAKNILMYFKKAVPAAIMFSADYIGFEILTFMASFLGPIQMAANVCLFNYITIIFMLQVGLSMAATTLVGNSIGARNKVLAVAYSRGSMLLGLIIMFCTTMITIFFRESIPGMYTQEKDVQGLFYKLIGIYVIFAMPDSLSVVLHGIIKGLGKQKWASVACLICLYPINITQAYFLAFYFKLGVIGLWYSQMITIFLMLGSYGVIYYYYCDLDEVIHEIDTRSNRSRDEKEAHKNEDI